MRNRHGFGLFLAVIAVLNCSGDGVTAPPRGGGGEVAAAVTIVPSSVQFGAIGSSVTLTAVATNAAGDTLDNVQIEWSMVGSGVASVNSTTGQLTATGNGSDTVMVTSGTVSAKAPVTVQQVPVTLEIHSVPAQLTFLGASVFMRASVFDSLRQAIQNTPITWTTSDPGVLPLDGDNRIVAAGAGAATLVATDGTRSDSASITVVISGPLGGPIDGASTPCAGGMAGPFPCDRVELLSYTPIAGIGGQTGTELNDIWGWTDPVTGNEYALVGRTDGVAFVNISDPVKPVYVGQLLRSSGAPQSIWRDLKVYNDHVFVVADASFGHGMQVFDLTGLRDYAGVPISFSETTRYTGVVSVHNIAINEATGFAYLVGSNRGGTTCGGGLHMVDISTPASPIFAGCFADTQTGFGMTGYTHDVLCILYNGPDAAHSGAEICFGSNENSISIADVSDKNNPVALSRASYPNVGYVHQGWISQDHRYFYTNDELDELTGGTSRTRTIIWDVQDLDDPLMVGSYLGPNNATDHNFYINGSILHQSNYAFGIRFVDLTDPVNPVERGFFDTSPQDANNPGFGGSWSNYPYFASGVVAVTSGAEGLFVVRLTN